MCLKSHAVITCDKITGFEKHEGITRSVLVIDRDVHNVHKCIFYFLTEKNYFMSFISCLQIENLKKIHKCKKKAILILLMSTYFGMFSYRICFLFSFFTYKLK